MRTTTGVIRLTQFSASLERRNQNVCRLIGSVRRCHGPHPGKRNRQGLSPTRSTARPPASWSIRKVSAALTEPAQRALRPCEDCVHRRYGIGAADSSKTRGRSCSTDRHAPGGRRFCECPGRIRASRQLATLPVDDDCRYEHGSRQGCHGRSVSADLYYRLNVFESGASLRSRAEDIRSSRGISFGDAGARQTDTWISSRAAALVARLAGNVRNWKTRSSMP
jgi:hypothetical protein